MVASILLNYITVVLPGGRHIYIYVAHTSRYQIYTSRRYLKGVPSHMDEGQAFRPVPFNIGLLVQVQSEYQHLIYKYRTVNSHLFNGLHLFTPFCKNCISARYICESAHG